MTLWKSRKRKAIEHWREMVERYDDLADENQHSGKTVQLSVHYRCIAALYRFNALELEGKH